ncbi:MAG: DNA repair protein RecO [Eubacteriales bacterium]|nr:DNA repair protein RecO [Eubacteriales bacterium]
MSDRVELTGMVLQSAPIGEYDRRVVLLTRERGRISGFARGARRQNSPLIAATKPFTFGTFECYEGKSSYNIYQAQVINYFEELSQDFEAAYYGMYFLEFAEYYTRENNDERDMLNLLYVTLRALTNPRLDRRLIRYVYELRTMVVNGEYPECFACVNCGSREHLVGYSNRKNGTLCVECIRELGGQPLLDSTIYTLQYVILAPFEKLYQFTVTPAVLEEYSAIVDRFRKLYVDREFKTLGVLETLSLV